MNIEVYCLAHQEERIMPYFMRHYSRFAQVILMEGHSTDRTVMIAESYGAKIMKVDTSNQVNDEIYLELKNNVWKGSKADWVIVCDADEFVYHPDLVNYLKETKSTVFLPRLWNMYSEVFPSGEGQIYDEVQYGKEGGAKMNLFRPDQLTEINYAVGCHFARPEGNVILDTTSPIMTLHMRHLSRKYVIDKNRYLFSRLSDVNKKHSWGYHLAASEDEINRHFNNELTALIKVI